MSSLLGMGPVGVGAQSPPGDSPNGRIVGEGSAAGVDVGAAVPIDNRGAAGVNCEHAASQAAATTRATTLVRGRIDQRRRMSVGPVDLRPCLAARSLVRSTPSDVSTRSLTDGASIPSRSVLLDGSSSSTSMTE